jgi:hypothetical protein
MKLPVIEVALLIAPLAIVPLGLRLVAEDAFTRAARRLVPFAAALAVAAFFPRPGAVAAALAAPWFLVTAILGLSGLARLRAARDLAALLVAAAHLFITVGGAMLVQSRLGLALFGFEEPIILLTAVHFHHTGFAAPILVSRLAGTAPRAFFRFAAFGTIAGPPLTAAGFMFSPALQAGAASLLAAGLAAAAILQLRTLPSMRSRGARDLLAVASTAILAGMALAVVYALGEFLGRNWIGIPAMAWSHGALNGLGFALCGLLAWTLEERRRGHVTATSPPGRGD